MAKALPYKTFRYFKAKVTTHKPTKGVPNMKRLTRLTATVALTFALTLTALAGETLTPPCPPPDPGEVLTPPCVVAQNVTGDESATVQTVSTAPESSNDFLGRTVTIGLLEITLSIF